MTGGRAVARVAVLCTLCALVASLAVAGNWIRHDGGRVELVGDDDLFDMIPPVTYTPRGVTSHSALPPEDWPQNWDGYNFVQVCRDSPPRALTADVVTSRFLQQRAAPQQPGAARSPIFSQYIWGAS